MENDLNFENMLAGLAEDYRKAEPMDNFMPDDGEYTVILSDLAKGVKVKAGEAPLIWISVKAKLLAAEDPNIDQKTMSLGFFSSKTLGMLKGFVQALIPSSITPDSPEFIDVNDLSQCIALIQRKVDAGTLLTIKVATSKKGYKNASITGLVDNTMPEAPTA